ncbi:MAG TPA: GTPase Era [Tepidimicrobium sp.]|nr:GTPase Era [Tepidimicrobium sp.]
MYRSGFVTVVGRPNVGKSTLLNHIIGEKISIISDKPQTTRNKIQLVYTEEDFQIVFLDTPGIQMPKNKLGEYMLKVSKSTLDEVDIITFMVDHSMDTGKLDTFIIRELRGVETPVVLLINKVDKLTEDQVNNLIEKYNNMDMFEDIIPISALDGYNVDAYVNRLKELLPEGPQYFPEDMITDQPERLIISEIIREKALENLEEEVPHGIFVEVERIEAREDRDLLDIHGTIYCERDSHKGIVIGKGGRMLRRIGRTAREDIERLMGSQVNLQLWVKVDRDWREKESRVRRFGYR